MSRVAVIGAGVAGLTAGYELAKRGWEVDVYERWPGLGGQAATLDLGDGVLVERYYHHLFTSDRHIASLVSELGVRDGIEWLPSSVAFFRDGRSHAFTTPLDLLRFSPLSLRSRVRLGLAVVRLQGSRDVEPFESVTAAEWIRRSMGEEAWTKIWRPLLRGKFGERAEDISMAWVWSKLTLRRQVRGQEAKGEVLGYPSGTFERLFVALADAIEERGGRVMVDRPAARLGRSGDALEVVAGEAGSFRRGHDPRRFEPVDGAERYDAVVATVPNRIFEQLLAPELAAELDGGYAERLRSIEYHAAICLLLELDRPFGRFYWTNIAEPGMPFVGLIEQTNLVPAERYGGRHLLYVANYVPAGDPLLDLSSDELLQHYEAGLRAVNRNFDRAWVRRAWLHREPDAQPIVTVGYRDLIPPLDTGAPGLVLANTTQVYPEDRGTNYAVRLGRDAAATVAA
jgi:protoporphyrinogen oxidase